jgi:hypothetical protein
VRVMSTQATPQVSSMMGRPCRWRTDANPRRP